MAENKREGSPEGGKVLICGIDEAGRGPLAGPVCAAAVILPGDFPPGFLDDSKKLKPREREEARSLILEKARAWGIGWASAPEIDRINILRASLLAMKRAWEALRAAFFPGPGIPAGGDPLFAEPLPGGQRIEAVIDGLYAPDIPVPCRPMVKADAQVPEVMAASILAKTARDRVMDDYARLYPQYGYEKHKGYPTRAHREMIEKYGPSPIQRMSFRLK
jgi:ribonuclease HII